MKAVICDRCKKILGECDDRIGLTLNVGILDGSEKVNFGELCSQCYDSFLDWIWDVPVDAGGLKDDMPEKPEEVDQPEEIEKKEPENTPQPEIGHSDIAIPAKKVKKGGTFVRWTKDDISKLIIGYKHQKTIAEMAKELRRTESAVTQRIIILKNANEL